MFTRLFSMSNRCSKLDKEESCAFVIYEDPLYEWTGEEYDYEYTYTMHDSKECEGEKSVS
ncbi:hypothetical protein ACFSCZ_18050 [Siminovitchia sediminis]|uniref:Uncharacterized protein n=1 Tax=Siminovitchia sediminis TaxID=1274353 RepID=A0ABW4KMZ2_9BACI